MPPEAGTLRAVIATGERALAAGPHPERARQDVETLLLHILGREHPERNRAWLLANPLGVLMPGLEAEFEAFLARRVAGEPIQYILGQTEFFGLPFEVAPGVLIPRPETEHLVEEAIRLRGGIPRPQIADIGTGSGAIAVALASALPEAQLWATDLSVKALEVARHNACRNEVAGRITFLEGDLVTPLADGRFDLIASNPPYVPLVDRDTLSVEVRDHEPHTALFAGLDGLDIYRRLIPEAHPRLVSGGWLVLEIGYGQQPAIQALLQSAGFGGIHFIHDYQGIPRVACAQRE